MPQNIYLTDDEGNGSGELIVPSADDMRALAALISAGAPAEVFLPMMRLWVNCFGKFDTDGKRSADCPMVEKKDQG